MWDSAKKPIKVRTIIQPNGMRHFIIDDQAEILTKPRKTVKVPPKPDQINNNPSKMSSYPVLVRSNTFTEGHPRWTPPSTDSPAFLGVAGCKINNSRYKQPRHFHPIMDKSQFAPELIRFSPSHSESLDFLPLKSPVIKQLINERRGPAPPSLPQSRSQSTTLCSRIMTWIDLEVKRNQSSSSRIGRVSSLETSLISDLPDSSETGSCSGSSITSDSSGVSLPKLTPCWKKAGLDQGKKSVRICEDLPRWGKMKRKNKSRTDLESTGNEEIAVAPVDVEEMESGLDETQDVRTDGLVVDETAQGSGGRLHVHIFLPQTKSASGQNKAVLQRESGRDRENGSA